MYQQQRGMTFIGTVTVLVILGLGLYAGIRLTPLYLEYMKVARALEQVRDEYAAVSTSVPLIRDSLDKRWNIEDIHSIDYREVQIRKTGKGYEVRAWYRAEAPFVANVSLVADFDKIVEIPQ